MIALLRDTLFSNKYVSSERPDEIAYSFLLSAVGGTSVGFTSFDHLFWIQVTVVVLLESIQNVTLAILIYKYIHQQRGTVTSYLLGYGFICPLLLCTPFVVIQALDLRNMALMVAAAAGPSLMFFRCLEAMHGTIPSFATQSLERFVLYYAATIQFAFDPETQAEIPVSTKEFRRKSFRFLQLFSEATLLFSILIPCRYHYFLSSISSLNRSNAFSELINYGCRQVADNLVLAFLTSICLDVGSTAMGIVTSLLSGLSTVDLNFSPLTASLSPSEFWGQRWNTLVSSALKRGVFVPLRQSGYSRNVAALSTFVASGILHEYIIGVMVHRTRISHHDELVVFGKHFLFFTWNAVVLIVEELLGDTALVKCIVQHVPRPLRTCLVLLTVLPISNLFTDVYVDVGFYDDFSAGFPRLIWMS